MKRSSLLLRAATFILTAVKETSKVSAKATTTAVAYHAGTGISPGVGKESEE